MPAPERQAVLVGLFGAGAVTILVGGVLFLGDIHDTFVPKVTLHAVFRDVGGLERGDKVWFSGVKVGLVKELELLDDQRVGVTLRIDRAVAEDVRTDTLASIGSDGLIGNRIVVLSGGTPEAPVVAEGAELAVTEGASSEEMLATLL